MYIPWADVAVLSLRLAHDDLQVLVSHERGTSVSYQRGTPGLFLLREVPLYQLCVKQTELVQGYLAH